MTSLNATTDDPREPALSRPRRRPASLSRAATVIAAAPKSSPAIAPKRPKGTHSTSPQDQGQSQPMSHTTAAVSATPPPTPRVDLRSVSMETTSAANPTESATHSADSSAAVRPATNPERPRMIPARASVATRTRALTRADLSSMAISWHCEKPPARPTPMSGFRVRCEAREAIPASSELHRSGPTRATKAGSARSSRTREIRVGAKPIMHIMSV